MEHKKKDRESFDGFHIAEDLDIEKALEEYKAADERFWALTREYLYPPEEVPYVGQRQLVFPNVAARDAYEDARHKVIEAEARYERIANERRQGGQSASP